MNQLTINTFLICITTEATTDQWEQVFEFLEWKKKTLRKLLCITTSGREDYSQFGEIRKILEERGIPHTPFGLISKVEPVASETYTRIELALSFENRDNGVLLISELPLTELFLPIQKELVFVPEDLLEEGDKDNGYFLEQFVLSLSSNPNLVIYDAQGMKFIP
jgi:hypothetical protein